MKVKRHEMHSNRRRGRAFQVERVRDFDRRSLDTSKYLNAYLRTFCETWRLALLSIEELKEEVQVRRN